MVLTLAFCFLACALIYWILRQATKQRKVDKAIRKLKKKRAAEHDSESEEAKEEDSEAKEEERGVLLSGGILGWLTAPGRMVSRKIFSSWRTGGDAENNARGGSWLATEGMTVPLAPEAPEEIPLEDFAKPATGADEDHLAEGN